MYFCAGSICPPYLAPARPQSQLSPCQLLSASPRPDGRRARSQPPGRVAQLAGLPSPSFARPAARASGPNSLKGRRPDKTNTPNHLRQPQEAPTPHQASQCLEARRSYRASQPVRPGAGFCTPAAFILPDPRATKLDTGRQPHSQGPHQEGRLAEAVRGGGRSAAQKYTTSERPQVG